MSMAARRAPSLWASRAAVASALLLLLLFAGHARAIDEFKPKSGIGIWVDPDTPEDRQ
ncbi:hypothetical protein PybrP1_003980, partial [[Pythium] brassicae (nom. inval.)]